MLLLNIYNKCNKYIIYNINNKMDSLKDLVTNPLSGLLAGLSVGALAGYQIGLSEGRK